MMKIKNKQRISDTIYQSQFPIYLQKDQKIAFIVSRLGDSLISMIVVNNLVQNGFKVTVFGDYIFSLKNLFPWVDIHPKPESNLVRETLVNYDVLLHAFSADILADAKTWHPFVRVLEDSPYNWLRIPMVDIQVKFCVHELLLKNVTQQNNISPASNLVPKKYPNRIVIHPTSYEKKRSWTPEKFLALAKSLQQRGFDPQFIVSPSERATCNWLVAQGFALPEFSSLEQVASWIFESGWFIGNDSGIGHLASNLNIPTVTLGMRKRLLQRWRPGWAKGEVLFPPPWLVTRPLKEACWQYLISVKQVLDAFDRLRFQCN